VKGGEVFFIDFLLNPFTILEPTLAIAILSFIISFGINLCYKFLSDQQKISQLKHESREIALKIKEAQKQQDVDKLNKLFSEAMQKNAEVMRLTFKPMIVSMIFVLIFLPWLNQHYTGIVIKAPIIGSIPFGWLGWYFIVSLPSILITRRLLGIEL
jgi:uncharacterized membrane protein (DUF106 family)